MFTARYALSPYIKQTRFVLKGLNVSTYLHSGFCLKTGPCFLAKLVLHTLRPSSSSFSIQYTLSSLSSSSSCLPLLPRLTITSILGSIFLSITCFRKQFPGNTWPIQLFTREKKIRENLHKTIVDFRRNPTQFLLRIKDASINSEG